MVGLFKFIAAAIAGCLVLSNWIITGLIATYYHFGLSIRKLFLSRDTIHFFTIMYRQPYNRIAPFVIGMTCGYLLQKHGSRGNMNKKVVVFGWVIAAGLSSSIVFGGNNVDPSQGISSLYCALGSSVWSVALSWMIYACCNGFGGLVNSILSLSFWKPLGRLTYSAYLIHVLIVRLYFLTGDENAHFTQFLIISSVFPIAVYTYIISIFFYLAFEAPYMELMKLIKLF
uniref:Acyltransferase 3 domain-containing protein n=1 Tax=Strigamia maritima TaxID=126957 RepID=T1IS58_STRMM